MNKQTLVFSDSFENLAARFVATVVQTIPEHLTSVVFASPLSARSPDLCMLWHTGYRKKHKASLFIKLLILTIAKCIRGIIRLFGNIELWGYALYGEINNEILVVTSSCGSFAPNGEFRTEYVSTEKDDAIFVFGPADRCGKNTKEVSGVSFKVKLTYTIYLLKSGIFAFFKMKASLYDRLLLLLQWFSWVVSLQWLYFYCLEVALSNVVEKYNINKIGCIHEMHNYSRIVWRVASRYKAKGYTVQHAVITSGKRWYFSYPEEIESGLVLPDVMYIYNQDVEGLLQPYFPNTRFVLGCSSRYAHWKEIYGHQDGENKYYLFAGALARFDNEVLIASIRNLLKVNKCSVPIRLRLHPKAVVGFLERYWLRSSIKKGLIEISNETSLRSDLKNSIAIIGMSTTVLEEALLLGCPVIQLKHPDYIMFINLDGISGSKIIDYKDLSEKIVDEVSGMHVDSVKMRERLGLNQPVVTYERLFSNSMSI